ncbi:UPF0692 protein C19orf54 homolog [Trachemys scripta elegans]|uniref:UPF0692 protein C19orf54 homolog n=1 Tax=Trachemys scripta elegans TaxID=31138 RepID=UPI001554D120|nr:UPF0692 protein C19orf54 homolog [Trachemys scripta elegans]
MGLGQDGTALGRLASSSPPAGLLLGLRGGALSPACQEDGEIAGLFHPSPACPPPAPEDVLEIYLLSKQGKSWRPQLWSYRQAHESNAQLTDFCPKRAGDGKVYVVPCCRALGATGAPACCKLPAHATRDSGA